MKLSGSFLGEDEEHFLFGLEHFISSLCLTRRCDLFFSFFEIQSNSRDRRQTKLHPPAPQRETAKLGQNTSRS